MRSTTDTVNIKRKLHMETLWNPNTSTVRQAQPKIYITNVIADNGCDITQITVLANILGVLKTICGYHFMIFFLEYF